VRATQFVALLVAVALTVAVTPARATGTPQKLVVHGIALVEENGYLVFTTGDAVKLAPGVATNGVTLGRPVRVVLDPATHLATELDADPGPEEPGEVDAAALPRAYVAVDPRSAQAPSAARGAGTQAGLATVTIGVRVPDDTPPGDDIYLATDRSGFSASELRLNRVDAHRWSIALQLAAGSTLHYLFTRGSYATVERTRGGGIAPARSVTATGRTTVDDAVARWADTT
jgi:hypothetical protein